MARTARLVGPCATLAEMTDGVEILFARTELAMLPAFNWPDTCHYVTLLVNLCPDPRQRLVIREVGFALTGVRLEHEVLTGPSWERDLRRRVGDMPPGRCNVVLMVPSHEDTVFRRAQRALEAIELDSPHTFGVVVVVAQRPFHWRQLTRVDGFVRSPAHRLASDSLAVLALLLTFTSPTLLTLSDDSDVADALGDDLRSSTIAFGQWNHEEMVLGFPSQQDKEMISSAEALSLSPLWTQGSWQSAHAMMNQVRALIRPDTEYVYNVSTDFFATERSAIGDRWSPVVFVCKPRLGFVSRTPSLSDP